MAYRYGVIAVIVSVVAALVIQSGWAVGLPAAWLVAINVVTFITYGIDKWIAGSEYMRVPERVLLFLALAGGSPGAWFGMQIFRHKTAKHSFQQGFWLVVLLQIMVAIAALVVLRK